MRGTNIQTNQACGVDTKILERAFQLEPAATHIFLVPARNFNFCVTFDRRARLVGAPAVYLHLARKNHRRGFFGGFGKRALHKK